MRTFMWRIRIHFVGVNGVGQDDRTIATIYIRVSAYRYAPRPPRIDGTCSRAGKPVRNVVSCRDQN